MSLFLGLKAAKPSFSKNYVRDGQYFVLAGEFKGDETTQTTNGQPMVIHNLTCVHALDDDDGKGHTVGEDFSHMIVKRRQMEAMFWGEIKRMLMNLLDMDEGSVDDDTAEMVYSKDQPLAGQVMEIKVTGRPQKNDPSKVFTHVTYVRIVPAEELLATLSESCIDRFFPDGTLQQRAEAEAEAK